MSDDRLARLRNVVALLTPQQLHTFAASLDDPDDVALLEEVVGQMASEAERGADSLVHWRADPARMGHHLNPGRGPGQVTLWPYVVLLGEAFARTTQVGAGRLIVNLPAQYGKSTLCSQWGPAWHLDRWPDRSLILASYGDQLAEKNALAVRDILEGHGEVLRANLRRDQRRKDRFLADEGGGVLATGINSTATGFPAHGLVIDDPFKGWPEAHSEANRQRVWNQYRSVFRLRLTTDDAWIMVVMTRWHEQDLAGRLQQEAWDGTGEEFEVLRLPEMAEVPDPTSTNPVLRRPDPLSRMPGAILEPERFGERAVAAKRLTLGPYLWCTPAETPILMADWTCKPISQVMPGDEVVGFVSERGHKLKLVRSVVKRVGEGTGEVWDYAMESGRLVRATREHRWFTRAGRPYRPANVGTPLRFLCPTEEDVDPADIPLWNYLAGIIDGEGHFRPFGVIDICQTIDKNRPVAEKILEVLKRLGIEHRVDYTERTRAAWAPRMNVDIHGSADVCRRLLRLTELAKREQAAEVLFNGAGRTQRMQDRVRSIDNPRTEPIFALETETGNYVAWGYFSANSGMAQQRPAPEEGTDVLRAWFQLEETLPGRADEAISSWDMKLKDKEAGDYVVGQCWWRVGGGYWLMEQLRGQWNEATTKVAMALMTVRHPEIRRHYYENAGNAPELTAELRRGEGPDYVVPDVVADKLGMTPEERLAVQALMRRGLSSLVPNPPKGDKRVRMRAVSGVIAGLNVHLPAHAPFVPQYLEEMAAFPNGANDDQVDATSQALSKLSKPAAAAGSPGGSTSAPRVPTRASAVAGAGASSGPGGGGRTSVVLPGVARR